MHGNTVPTLSPAASCWNSVGAVPLKRELLGFQFATVPTPPSCPPALRLKPKHTKHFSIWVAVFFQQSHLSQYPLLYQKWGKLEKRLSGIWKGNLSSVLYEERLLKAPWHLVAWIYPFELYRFLLTPVRGRQAWEGGGWVWWGRDGEHTSF